MEIIATNNRSRPVDHKATAVHPHPEPPSLKLHICRVCGKGFASGCALGGHMHIHGTHKDFNMEDDDEDDEDYDIDDTFTMTDSTDANSEPYSFRKLTYSLRTNGGTYRNNHAAVFDDSWNPIDHDIITNRSISSDVIDDDAWCKSKSKSKSKPFDTDEEVAHSLMMLSRGEGLCGVEAAISKQASLRMPPLMVPPIRYRSIEQMPKAVPVVKDVKPVSGYTKLFECKSCNKVFTSHQALGGHRASHRKVKGCSSSSAALTIDEPNTDLLYPTSHAIDVNSKAIVLVSEFAAELPAGKNKKKTTRIHKCTICHRLFPTGQALGGHKRCHWLVQNGNQPNSHPATRVPTTVAPVLFSNSNNKPLNLFLDKPNEPPGTCKPMSPILDHFPMPELGLVTACPGNNIVDVVDDEADSNNVTNSRKRKPVDDRLADLGPDDWLRVGIGSYQLPA